MSTRSTGEHTEELACRYLEKQGLTLITRNYHCKGGEIDLIMQDADSLVFIEVRYRRRTDFGGAAESISRTKQQRIAHCARYYMNQRRAWNKRARFDVIAIEGDLSDIRISWMKDAFQLPG